MAVRGKKCHLQQCNNLKTTIKMNEITVTSPTRVKCLNANGDEYNYIYIDDSCVQLEVNMSPDLKTTFGVSSQEIYAVSNDSSFLGIRYQYGTTPILDENTLVPKSYVDAKIAEAISNL